MQRAAQTLLTGATGFVGSAVARALIRAGFPVRALVRLGSPRSHLSDLQLEFVEGDLRDADSVGRAVEGIRYVFHVAADYRLWARDPREIFAANVDGTRNVMQAALRADVERVVYTSSVATLGLRPDGMPADEANPLSERQGIGAYKRSKIADGHIAALEHGVVGERYILGGANVTFADMLADIARLVGRKPPRLHIPRAAVMPIAYAAETLARFTGREPFATVDGVRMAKYRMFFTAAKAERDLGYRPRPYLAGLEDAIRWFRENGYLDRK
jgi:dihydroflavonol-4-reductase